MTSKNSLEDDADIRAFLDDGLPDFASTPSLGDRALVGVARRRTVTRAVGGAGAVAVVAVGALAATSVLGTGSGGASPAGPPLPSAPHGQPPKEQAMERVETYMHARYLNAFAGLGTFGIDYPTTNPLGDDSPIVVYRKPGVYYGLETDVARVAAPFQVVFKDSVLDASEQYVLEQRLWHDRDAGVWKSKGVDLVGAGLLNDGRLDVSVGDPAKDGPLIKAYYGYDVFVFHKSWMTTASPTSAPPPSAPTPR